MRLYLLALFLIPTLAHAHLPSLSFRYSKILDMVCGKKAGTPIPQEWVQEVAHKMPKFQEAWKVLSPQVLPEAFQVVGGSFSQKDIQAALVTCQEMPSISFPLVINVGAYLESQREHPAPIKYFAGIVFHELLHTLVDENLNEESSALLKKYSNESERTRGHLHVNAITVAVYRVLKREDKLQETIHFEERFGPDYVRAWQIVTDIEGYEPFVQEFHNSANQTTQQQF